MRDRFRLKGHMENYAAFTLDIGRMREKVAMLVSNAFRPDPRVHREARSLVGRGYDVTIIAWDRERKYQLSEVIDGIRIERIHVKSSYGKGMLQLFAMLFFWRKALFALMRNDMDIIHCHDFDTLPVGLLCKKLLGVKLVYDAHENYSVFLRATTPRLVSAIVAILERLSIRNVDSIITASTLVAKMLRQDSPCPVVTLGNWQPAGFPGLDEESLRRKRDNLPLRDKLIIIYIGGFGRYRVIVPLIDAVQRRGDAVALIAGDGPQRPEIERRCRDTENAVYLGWIDPADVPYYVSLSDVVYYALDHNAPATIYNAPNSLGYAVSMGKAVIASDAGDLGRIVREIDCGMLLENNTADEIEAAIQELQNVQFLERCKRNATRAGRQEYNWQAVEQQLLDLYDRLRS